MNDRMVGIYVHIPFCRTRCGYCDFNTYSGLEQLIPEYTRALLSELESWKSASLTATSLYLGGGTPSLLPYEYMQLILKGVHTSFNIRKDAEITLEVNPGSSFIKNYLSSPLIKGRGIKGERKVKTLNTGTLFKRYLRNIKGLGVNRLSLGVQSFDDRLLRILGRIHNASEARETYIMAREVGFDNINLDLMYGLPTQTLKQWQDSLEEALELEPEHLSLYALTLEESTPLYTDIRGNKTFAPDSDMAADMYSTAEERLEDAGYNHYEISNWARPERESKHNLNYWHNGPYLGIGAGAHSYLNRERFWNAAQPQEYIRQVREKGLAVAGKELISPDIEKADYIILGLRLSGGLDLLEFKIRYDTDISQLYGDEMSFLKETGLLEELNGTLRLTSKGRLLGNEVFQRFLPKIRV